MTETIRIGILEDNVNFRKSIEDFLAMKGQFEIIFSEGAYLDIKHKKFDERPDIILLDVHLPDVVSIEIVELLKQKFPSVHIILMTGDQDKSLLLKAIEKGGSSYLIKPFQLSELITTINSLRTTGSYLQPDMLTNLMDQLVIRQKRQDMIGNIELTERESDVLHLVELGLTYKEIANRLFISYHTVNHHLKNIYIKFEVNSKIELLAKRK